jgi:hypothetical protein
MLNKFYNRTIATFLTLVFVAVIVGTTNAFAAPPPNDNFADAQALSGIQVHVAGTNVEATLEANEPLDQFNTISKSVWYKFTATKSRYYSIRTTRETNFDTHLTIYGGTALNNLVFKNSNNNVSLPNRTSVIITYMNQGETIYIRLAGETNNESIPAEGTFNLDITPLPTRQSSDFDRDGKTDFSVFRPVTGTWFVARSVHNNATMLTENWGTNGDIPVPADYDGNFRTDVAVFRPSNGSWYIKPNGGIPAYSLQFGQAGDIPVPGQYSFEGDMMPAVFRPSNGTWYFCNTNDYSIAYAVQFGQQGDVPVPGDYDTDGKTDIAVFRPSTGTWYILSSSDGFRAVQFGANGDKTVAADYDGDSITDIAVFRPSNGTWYVLRSSDNQVQSVQFGLITDVPTVGDYNGDGKADYAVFRPSAGAWYIAKAVGVPAQNFDTFYFGQNGDFPITKGGAQ